MHGMDFVRVMMMTGVVLVNCGCASHRAPVCPNPAKVVGAFSRDNQEGWVIVRAGSVR